MIKAIVILAVILSDLLTVAACGGKGDSGGVICWDGEGPMPWSPR